VLDTAFENIKKYFWDEIIYTSKDSHYEDLYLISHNGVLIKEIMKKNINLEQILSNKKNDLILKKINDHYAFLNQLHKEIYED
jgi:hypothetical protein